jgi:D-amino-acid dehydrogenase
MKIAIVGAGVNGLASAYELMLCGHAVTVFERRATAAEAGSFAPAGLLHPAWALAWADPMPRLRLPWSAPGPGVRWRSGLQWPAFAWWGQWRSARRRRTADARAALIDLLTLGQERHAALQAELELDHDRSDGFLVLGPDQRSFDRAAGLAVTLRELGLGVRPVSAAEARAIEPALDAAAPLAGAIHLTGPAVANCREWTLLMRQVLLRNGGRFQAQQAVRGLRPHSDGVELTTDRTAESFDAAVLCTGSDAPDLLRSLGLRTPFQPWWSHSLSAPVREPMDAPQSGVMDLQTGVTITRLGQRVRASGGWDLGGETGGAERPAIAYLARTMSHWFPAAARLGGAQSALQTWRGAALVSADGLPLIGASRVPGVWLNLAHGTMGWALACGAARHLADTMAGGAVDGRLDALSPSRLGL